MALEGQAATMRMAEAAPDRLSIFEQASKVRMAYLGERTNVAANEGAAGSEEPAAEAVEVPIRLEVSSLHSAGATLQYFKEEGVGITVSTGGVRVSAGDIAIRADNVVVWQPLSAEKKTAHFPATPRSMRKVT